LWHQAESKLGVFFLSDIVLGSTISKLTPLRTQVLSAHTKLREIVLPCIAEARLEAPNLDDDQKDLLHTMVSAKDEKGNNLFSDDDIYEEALTMLFAGHDTTKNAVSWAIYFLSQNTAEMKKLQNEVVNELKGKTPIFEDIPKLRCCKNALQEALRMRPPVTGLHRSAAEDCELGGFFIPKGSCLSLNFAAVHMDARLWEDPFTFNPDRFNTNENYTRFFVPFSVGNRNCIGQKFVMVEGILFLAMLSQRFTFELATELVVPVLEGTMTPKGLLCTFLPL